VLPFAAFAGRAAEHPVDPTAEAGKVGDAPARSAICRWRGRARRGRHSGS
jgi:hypothetical protein